jgi:hypothetical protein
MIKYLFCRVKYQSLFFGPSITNLHVYLDT